MTQCWKLVQLAITAFWGFGASVALWGPSGLGDRVQAAETATSSPAAGQEPGQEAEERAIRATADEFVRAFNAADARGIGALWASDAEYTDESGRAFHGRAAIEKEYADLFQENRGATMAVTIESLRFLGPDIAIEKGVAKVKRAAENSGTASRYTVVHARRDGQWIMVVGHDTPYVEVPNGDYLKPLEWLIGEWVPEAKDPPLRIKFEWIAQKSFIKSSFLRTKDGEKALTGGQIVGWNPKLGRIVSWHFDPQGGFGNDVWTPDGAKWVIDATGMFRDGSECSSVNIVTPLDADSFIWQSTNRRLEGVILPDTVPLKIVRVKSEK